MVDTRRNRSSRTRPSCTACVEPRLDAGHRTHVQADGFSGFDEPRFAIAEHAGEPRLDARRSVSEVLEVERAAQGLVQTTVAADTLQTSRSVLDLRPGGASEQFHVELLGLEGGTVDRHERAVSSSLRAVDRARRELASGAVFAANQHAGAHRRRARDHGGDVTHGRRVAVEIVAAGLRVHATMAWVDAQLTFDRIGHATAAERTGEDVGHSGQHGFDRQIRPA